jgi:glycosyltransferase involved in cell wall biosynthesis
MRVLYLNPFSQSVSGPDESLLGLLSALSGTELEAHLVLPAPGPFVERYRALGVEVHFAPLVPLRRDVSARALLYPPALIASALAVANVARKIRADLIHTNMEVLLEGGLAAYALRLPHVLHYRGNTLDNPKWVFDGLTAIWTAISDHIYCISSETAKVFTSRQRAAKTEVLYNPVDLARFEQATADPSVRRALGASGEQRLVGTVGRIHPRKDLETFLRAAALVARSRGDVQFSVIGTAEAPVERAYQQKLDALVAELGLRGRVTFAGTRRDVPAVMAALDAFVLTSRHEGFGRVVAEAMAAGRPVVVSDEGAPPELVGRGQAGLCATPADPSAFAAQLSRLLDPVEAARLSAAARHHAQRFDARALAGRVLARYQSLTGRGARHDPRRR